MTRFCAECEQPVGASMFCTNCKKPVYTIIQIELTGFATKDQHGDSFCSKCDSEERAKCNMTTQKILEEDTESSDPWAMNGEE